MTNLNQIRIQPCVTSRHFSSPKRSSLLGSLFQQAQCWQQPRRPNNRQSAAQASQGTWRGLPRVLELTLGADFEATLGADFEATLGADFEAN